MIPCMKSHPCMFKDSTVCSHTVSTMFMTTESRPIVNPSCNMAYLCFAVVASLYQHKVEPSSSTCTVGILEGHLVGSRYTRNTQSSTDADVSYDSTVQVRHSHWGISCSTHDLKNRLLLKHKSTKQRAPNRHNRTEGILNSAYMWYLAMTVIFPPILHRVLSLHW